MIALQEQLFEELRSLVADLGKDGGLISPSVYDTAQLLRLYPPAEGVEPGLDWLASQQKADGGWGDAAVPTARDVPTLAAILTLFTYRRDRTTRQIVDAGLDFLQEQSSQWATAHIDALPIATEMILPYLINEAAEAGLHIERKPYARLFILREKKLQYIHREPLEAGTAPTYSWEALGLQADKSLLDGSGGVGHSPSATAAWLRSASLNDDLQQYIPIAERYLNDAMKATGVDVSGVVPNAFPISGFEFTYGLYGLQMAGLLDHPLLEAQVSAKCEEMYQILERRGGMSFGHFFVPNVDDTSVSVVTLQSKGYQINSDYIWNFQNKDHFYTFKQEFNPSVFSNAHALHALYLCNERNLQTEKFLIERQLPDGYWHPDKWHTSWRYTTLEVMLPLIYLGYESNVMPVIDAFVNDQNGDGGWGMGSESALVETAYSILALSKLNTMSFLNDEAQSAFVDGTRKLLKFEHHNYRQADKYWLGKELYSPSRVDAIYVLGAKLAVLQDFSSFSSQGFSNHFGNLS